MQVTLGRYCCAEYHYSLISCVFFSELAEFLKQNKNGAALHAVYIVSGMLRISDPAGSCTAGNNTVDTCKRHRTQFVRDCDLERIRKTYSKVETCEMYCLHTKPVEVSVLFFRIVRTYVYIVKQYSCSLIE